MALILFHRQLLFQNISSFIHTFHYRKIHAEHTRRRTLYKLKQLRHEKRKKKKMDFHVPNNKTVSVIFEVFDWFPWSNIKAHLNLLAVISRVASPVLTAHRYKKTSFSNPAVRHLFFPHQTLESSSDQVNKRKVNSSPPPHLFLAHTWLTCKHTITLE